MLKKQTLKKIINNRRKQTQRNICEQKRTHISKLNKWSLWFVLGYDDTEHIATKAIINKKTNHHSPSRIMF